MRLIACSVGQLPVNYNRPTSLCMISKKKQKYHEPVPREKRGYDFGTWHLPSNSLSVALLDMWGQYFVRDYLFQSATHWLPKSREFQVGSGSALACMPC